MMREKIESLVSDLILQQTSITDSIDAILAAIGEGCGPVYQMQDDQISLLQKKLALCIKSRDEEIDEMQARIAELERQLSKSILTGESLALQLAEGRGMLNEEKKVSLYHEAQAAAYGATITSYLATVKQEGETK